MDFSVNTEPSSDVHGSPVEKMHKTSGYFQAVVAVHNIRDKAKEAVESLQERSISDRVQDRWNKTRNAVSSKTRNFFSHPENIPCEHIPQQYSYVFRPKSRWELVLLSGTVCGIEFCYSAETAFVTPILLSLGLHIRFVTMIWCLSPLIGFFLTPVLGSLSDSCESRFGRRRPFILLLSIGILLGLILVPNGNHIGTALGDTPNVQIVSRSFDLTNHSSIWNKESENRSTFEKRPSSLKSNRDLPVFPVSQNYSYDSRYKLNNNYFSFQALAFQGNQNLKIQRSAVKEYINTDNTTSETHVQPWSIVFTVIGTVLLDFCSDACQSPSRTYLLDVSLPEDHTAGLSTFTLMAGLGGSIGYLMGAVHWESTFLGNLLGGQVNAVFMIVTIIFIICLICTLCSFPEIPLPIMKDPDVFKEYQRNMKIGEFQEKGDELAIVPNKGATYGTASPEKVELEDNKETVTPNGLLHAEFTEANCGTSIPPQNSPEPDLSAIISDQPTLKEYLRSIVHMPKSLKILCLTNLFCWMSLVCYSLYFTDFVGEVVYGGDPKAVEGSVERRLFQDGVSFACWGMALYSISCSIYSFFIESLVIKFGAKRVYVGGQLVYSIGMIIMAAARHPVAVILLSPTAGVMYSTLFTMPYLLIAHYHCMQKFRDDKCGGEICIRGIGTDVASVSSMVFLSQFILSLSMGTIVHVVGSNVATVCTASVLAACGALSATQVMYLDM